MSDYNGKKECGNCLYCGKDDCGQGVCRRFPPKAAAALVSTPPVVPGGPFKTSWMIQPVLPPVRDKTPACGEFRAKPEIVN